MERGYKDQTPRFTVQMGRDSGSKEGTILNVGGSSFSVTVDE